MPRIRWNPEGEELEGIEVLIRVSSGNKVSRGMLEVWESEQNGSGGGWKKENQRIVLRAKERSTHSSRAIKRRNVSSWLQQAKDSRLQNAVLGNSIQSILKDILDLKQRFLRLVRLNSGVGLWIRAIGPRSNKAIWRSTSVWPQADTNTTNSYQSK